MEDHLYRARLCSSESLEGYFDTFSFECKNLEQCAKPRKNSCSEIIGKKDSSTQTDLSITFPDIFSQIFRDFTHDSVQSDISYANINKNEGSQNRVKNLLNHFESMSNTSLHKTESSLSIPSARLESSLSTPQTKLEGRPTPRALLEGRSTPQVQLEGRSTPQAQLENRVSKWIDQEMSDLNRISNSTLYEDIDDVLEYFEDFKDDATTPPPPLPPRYVVILYIYDQFHNYLPLSSVHCTYMYVYLNVYLKTVGIYETTYNNL